MASKTHIQEMMKVRGPYDINMAAVIAVQKALQYKDEVYQYVDEVINISKPLLESFFEKNAIRYFSGKTNFILFTVDNCPEAFEILLQNNIRTRFQKKTSH